MRDLLGVVDAATRALGSLRIRYVIVGGVAVNVLGRARSTLDVDIIAEFRVGSAARLESAFRKQGFRIREEEIVDALRERTTSPCLTPVPNITSTARAGTRSTSDEL